MTAGMVARNMLYDTISKDLFDILGEQGAYTIPTTPVAKREFVVPFNPRSSKMNGA